MTTPRAFCAIFPLVLAATAATASQASAQETATEPGKAVSAAPVPRSTAGEEQRDARPARRSPNRLSGEELRSATQSNLYDLIRAVRPRWMRQRGQGSINRPEGVRVYVDGSPADGLGALRGIEVTSVGSVEYLDGGSATMRWGTGHPNGAILVTTRSGN